MNFKYPFYILVCASSIACPVLGETASTSEAPALQKASVIEITTKEQLDKVLTGKKPVIVKYYTTWCGFCKNVAPVYEKLALENPNVTFAEVDTDKAPGLYKGPIPRFVVYDADKSGKLGEVGEVKGAPQDAGALKTILFSKIPSQQKMVAPESSVKTAVKDKAEKAIEPLAKAVKKTTSVVKAASKAHNSVVHISGNEQFKEEVTDSKVPVIVKYSASWCGPCKMTAKPFEALEKKYKGAKFVSVSLDDPANSKMYQGSIPFFEFYDVKPAGTTKAGTEGSVIKVGTDVGGTASESDLEAKFRKHLPKVFGRPSDVRTPVKQADQPATKSAPKKIRRARMRKDA